MTGVVGSGLDQRLRTPSAVAIFAVLPSQPPGVTVRTIAELSGVSRKHALALLGLAVDYGLVQAFPRAPHPPRPGRWPYGYWLVSEGDPAAEL